MTLQNNQHCYIRFMQIILQIFANKILEQVHNTIFGNAYIYYNMVHHM